MRSFRDISVDMFALTDPIAPSNTTPTYEVRRFMKACVTKTHTGIRPYLFSKFHSRHREKRRDPNAVFDTTAFKKLIEELDESPDHKAKYYCGIFRDMLSEYDKKP